MKKIVTLLFVLALTACASTSINYAQEASKINLGMNKADILAILGAPKKTSMRKSGDVIVEQLSYWSKTVVGFTTLDNEALATDRVTVILEDGKVIEYGDFLSNMDRYMDKSMENTKEMMKTLNQPQPNSDK